jgi:hypothetical protein
MEQKKPQVTKTSYIEKKFVRKLTVYAKPVSRKTFEHFLNILLVYHHIPA